MTRSYKNKKVLVSGAAGFLGSHLVNALISKGYNVVGVDNLYGGYMRNVNLKSKFMNIDCRDLTDKHLKGVDIVYHLASDATEGRSQFRPVFNTENNLLAGMNILKCAVNAGVKRFVFTSSMSRYGDNKTPFNEKQDPNPVDIYAINKVAFEKALQIECDIHGIDWSIAVPHNIYGPNQRIDDPYRNVVGIFINRSMKNSPHYIYGDGLQQRSFSNYRDCIVPLMKMGIQKDVVGHIINIGPDEKSALFTINELSKKVCTQFGQKWKPIRVPDRPKEVKLAFCSSKKARDMLNYKTTVDFDDGLNEMIEWALQMGPQKFRYDTLEIKKKCPKTWLKRLI